MTDFHVYGLGNALVDIEIEIDADELSNIGVEKGIMTLIDEERHVELLNKVQGNHHQRACGGSAANTTIAVAQLGGKSFYSCRIGNDETGDFYYTDLHNEGVVTNLASSPREDGVTGKCLVMITPDADRSMNTFLGITSELTESLLDFDALGKSKFLYIEGYLAASPTAVITSVKAIKKARELSVPVAFSLSDTSMVQFCREGLDTMLEGGVELLFCNEAEALAYTSAGSMSEACEALKKIANRFVVTLGPKGSIVFDGTDYHDISAVKVKAIDTNGAGDLFAGSFLYAITSGLSEVVAGSIASFASAKLVTSFGPRLNPEHLKEVRAMVNNHLGQDK
ncbi:MAG: sugar/nucleoside kinase (ribokinase family) [Enterobacterales bacterium]|jgi:sugar/nucleoside kinase (ribokinase family)